jgi:outer membrane protein TolC
MRYLIFAFLSICGSVKAQDKFLTLDATLDIIRKYHPVVKQASLDVEQAKAALTSSRGMFDPALYYEADRKTFDGSNYFNYTNPSLKIPTWYGIDIKAGLENNLGSRVDPTVTIGKSTYLGVSIPVLKGLLFDKRRAAVQQGKIFIRMSVQEQRQTINDLLQDAGEAYWKWTASYQVNQVLLKAIQVNENRVDFVRKAWQSGDRAAIDTVEAFAQLQSIQVMERQSWLDFQKARLILSNFMWTEDGKPYELAEEILPDTSWMLVAVNNYPVPVLDETLLIAMEEHPKLRVTSLKSDVLEIDRRSKFQNLLPKLDMSYNFLNKGYGLSKTFASPLFDNNFKYGVQFGLPLLQREARGEYRMAKIKIQTNQLIYDQARLEISNKVRAAFNEVIAVQQQVNFMLQNLKNQQMLLRAEEVKLKLGESSLFLVNSRENKLLETEQKYAEVRSKFFNSLISIQAAAGALR